MRVHGCRMGSFVVMWPLKRDDLTTNLHVPLAKHRFHLSRVVLMSPRHFHVAMQAHKKLSELGAVFEPECGISA